MNCTEINDPELLVYYFRLDDQPTLTRVLNCFRNEYYDYLLRFSYKDVFSKRTIPKDKEAGLLMEAFNTSLNSFYFYIRKNGFEQRGATVKTLFSEFYIRTLKGLARTLTKNLETYINSDPLEDANGWIPSISDFQVVKEEWEWEEKKLALFKTAFSQLDERCKKLLTLRKFERLSNEEIALQMKTLAANSVNNEVYKCFMRLKKIVDGLKKDDLWN